MVLVRMCILDLTQRLPDLVTSSSCHRPLPPEDRGGGGGGGGGGAMTSLHTHTLSKLDTCIVSREAWYW